MKIKVFFFVLTCYLWIGFENRGNISPAEAQVNSPSSERLYQYSWLIQSYSIDQSLSNRIQPPKNFERVAVEKNSFGDWLRFLPLKPENTAVKLYNGQLKYNQSAHFAVLDIDTGIEDLQQCADAVMRLKAEFHFSVKEDSKIHFNFTSGHVASYSKWKEGYRAKVNGSTVNWEKTATPSTSYKSFMSFMRQVFKYAGSSSLSKELSTVSINEIRPGDVFIRGGFPGHAVIVLDVVVNKQNGEKMFLLAQSYMPAQDIHVLINPKTTNSPWFSIDKESQLITPEWTFELTELKRFK